MWNSIFIVLLTVGGSLALGGVFRDCDMEMCHSPAEPKLILMAPNEEQLKRLCSPILERFECQNNAIKTCYGESLEELASSDNNSVATFSALHLNIQNVVKDLCDEDSLLHEGYVSSVGCYNEIMTTNYTKCYQEAEVIFQAFKESQELLGVVRDPMEQEDDRDCMKIAYAVACFTVELRDQCGEIARATMVEILKRVQYVTLGLGSCKREQVEVLRTTYLEFMEFEEEKKSWFSQVFNTRK